MTDIGPYCGMLDCTNDAAVRIQTVRGERVACDDCAEGYPVIGPLRE
jgi:hypothetical protein